MRIVVASGKGGTGKTTVSVGLALSLSGEVSLLDCDVEAPNTHLLLGSSPSAQAAPGDAAADAGGAGTMGDGATGGDGPRTGAAERAAPATPATAQTRFTIRVPKVDEDRCTGCGLCAKFCAYGALAVVRRRVLFFDDLCHACGGCARVCPERAITEVPHEIGTIRTTDDGALRHVVGELDVGQTLAPPLIRAVKARAGHGTTVIDAAPGATCPVVEAARGSDAGLLVTENTPFGLHDLKLAAEVFSELGVPTGIVVNRSGIGHADEHDLDEVSRRFGFPVLMRIPYSEAIARAYADGRPIVDAEPGLQDDFRALHRKLAEMAETAHTGDESSTGAAS